MLSDESAVKVSDVDIEVSTAAAKALFDWAVKNALFVATRNVPPKYFKLTYVECLLRLALHFGGDEESFGLYPYLSKVHQVLMQNSINPKKPQECIRKYLPAHGSKQEQILTGERSIRVRTVKDTYSEVSNRLKKLESRSDFAEKKAPLSRKPWKQVLVSLQTVNLNILVGDDKGAVFSPSSNIRPFNRNDFLAITRHSKYDNVYAAKHKYGKEDFVIKFTDNKNDEGRELELLTKYIFRNCIVLAERVYDVSQEDLQNVFGMSKGEAFNFRYGFVYPAYPATLAEVFRHLDTNGIKMPMAQKDALAYMVLHVLSVLHSAGYAYLDLTPENIFLWPDMSEFLSKSPRDIIKALPDFDAELESGEDGIDFSSERGRALKFKARKSIVKLIGGMSVTAFGSTIDDAAVTFAYCPHLQETTVVSRRLDYHPAAIILCQIYLGEDVLPPELFSGVSMSQATALKNVAWRDGIKKRWHKVFKYRNELWDLLEMALSTDTADVPENWEDKVLDVLRKHIGLAKLYFD